jgi:hypothetical protein
VAQCRAVQPVVPHDRGAAGIAARHRWHVACSGRSWSKCSRSSAAPTPRSAVPTPPSHFPALTDRPAPCAVEGAHAAQHARRAGANARSQRAL